MNTISPFYTDEINTGKIFILFNLKLEYNVKPYSDEKVYTRILKDLKNILHRRNIISEKWETMSEKVKEFYKNNQDTKPKTYFIRDTGFRKGGYSGNEHGSFDTVYYREDCILKYDKTDERELYDFRLFFALNIAFTDVWRMDGFLNFQLKKNFNGNIQEYDEFLNNILLYTPITGIDLIPQEKREKVKKYIKEHTAQIEVTNTDTREKFDTPVKSYSPKELHALYNKTAKAFNSWLAPHKKNIGELKGRTYTPKQVQIIFSIIGEPPSPKK